jgi:hypothetical protein
MNNNMQKYRIKQIGENKFIPQTSTTNIFAILFGEWDGIELFINETTITWYGGLAQIQYCTVETIEEAKHVIEIHKKQSTNKLITDKQEQTYPKYHKVD